ncbi:MAG: Lipopolysaccharide core biosynthesis protein RfaG [Chlamydiales bacterium]|nr:Lipopolysaccharide core biosynthesis protein RfaG [Chlamydiales bacterium]MCH9619136.1 Lipopolysaccharide core biosynthesis protein RfaG [Chlamydiales bacterium]MCH9622398.1 Lipopolysaccharide core biosynthesis protein RfaG [Chlamydiales bacterium]
MKVALLKSRIENRGGLEKATQRLAEAFEEKGCEVSLLTTGSTRGINVCSSSKLALYHHFKFDLACKRFLKKHPHPIVFGMERNRHQTHYRAGSGVHAVYLERRKQCEGRFKHTLNPLNAFLLKREKETFEYPGLKRLFTNSHMVKNEILDRFAVDPEKITVIHNGVEWKALEQPFALRKKTSTFTFLFVGNGYRRKGLDLLLKALPKECHLIVVGKEKNLSTYRAKAPPNVTFVGAQANLIPFYQTADALVIPSLYDPFANVTVEALAMGLYVVSSPYNGGHEVLQKSSGCVIEELFSQDALEMALKKALSTTIDRASIRESVKHLDFSHQLSKMINLTLH